MTPDLSPLDPSALAAGEPQLRAIDPAREIGLDAARYQWLRKECGIVLDFKARFGDELDEMIDRARQPGGSIRLGGPR